MSKKFLVIFLFCMFSGSAFAAQSRNLTVFAEQNTVVPLTKIARIYSQKNNVVVSINFNSSAELLTDIDAGDPADVFISAHHILIETLKQKGLVDIYNIGYIARDNLVLTTSNENKKIPDKLKNPKLENSLRILNQEQATVITDQEGSSSGRHSNDFVQSLSLSDLKLFAKLPEDTSPLLNTLKENPERYVLLLESQIKNKDNLKVVSRSSDGKIFYQAFVIAGDNMETAREFLKFLKSNAAKTAFKESGFSVN